MRSTLEGVHENLTSDGIAVFRATVSPIKGHKGNTEFLALLKDREDAETCLDCVSFLKECGLS